MTKRELAEALIRHDAERFATTQEAYLTFCGYGDKHVWVQMGGYLWIDFRTPEQRCVKLRTSQIGVIVKTGGTDDYEVFDVRDLWKSVRGEQPAQLPLFASEVTP